MELKILDNEEQEAGGFCPIINSRCVEENCALWIHEGNICAETVKALSLSFQAANNKETQKMLLCSCEAIQNKFSLIVENLSEISNALDVLARNSFTK